MRNDLRNNNPAATRLLDTVRHNRNAKGHACAHCGSSSVKRWGSFAGRQRYRCRLCGRTYSDLTGTVFARSRRLDAWERYLALMRETATLRFAAAELDIHVATSFRWRHRVLRRLGQGEELLSGTVETAEVSFAYSEKGQRAMSDPPRVRGARGRFEWFDVPRLRVLVALARNGWAFGRHMDGELVSRPALEQWFVPQLSAECIVICGPGCTSYAKALRPHGHTVHVLGYGATHTLPDETHHVRAAKAFARRLLTWMNRFRGVASKYLNRYLLWHRTLEFRIERIRATTLALLSHPAPAAPP